MHFLKAVFSFLVLMTVTLSFTFAQPENFSGDWKRNTEKTDPGNLSINSVPVSLGVKQDDKSIGITRTAKNKEGETFVYTEILHFDGTVTVSSPKPNMKKTATGKWSDDQKSFLLSADYVDSNSNPVQKVKESWSLADDGKTLVITTVLDANGQTFDMKEVFDKQ